LENACAPRLSAVFRSTLVMAKKPAVMAFLGFAEIMIFFVIFEKGQNLQSLVYQCFPTIFGK